MTRPQVAEHLFLSNKGLNIPEVAHDYHATIKQYAQQLGMVNSYTTLGMVRYLLVFSGELIGVIAGTKNVVKQLRHICAGMVRTRDRMWFTELSDKGMYFLDIFQQGAPRCTCIGA